MWCINSQLRIYLWPQVIVLKMLTINSKNQNNLLIINYNIIFYNDIYLDMIINYYIPTKIYYINLSSLNLCNFGNFHNVSYGSKAAVQERVYSVSLRYDLQYINFWLRWRPCTRVLFQRKSRRLEYDFRDMGSKGMQWLRLYNLTCWYRYFVSSINDENIIIYTASFFNMDNFCFLTAVLNAGFLG